MDLILVMFAVILGTGFGLAQKIDNAQDLAHLLSKAATRQNAVARITEERDRWVPVLLSWTRAVPPELDRTGLYTGMAEAFGRLKTREAIPFLIKNITLQSWPASPNIWMKTPEVIQARLPAVAALIQIGPDAATALMNTRWGGLSSEERLAVIFVVSRTSETPESRSFLATALGEANLQCHWAEEGLKYLERGRTPKE